MNDAPSIPSPPGRGALVLLVACAALLSLAALVAMFLVPYPSTPTSAGGLPPTVTPVPGVPSTPGSGMGDAVPPSGMAGGETPSTPVATTSEPFTEKVLDERIMSRPLAMWSMLVLRFGAAIAGLVVLILYAVKRGDVRKGLLPPPPTRPLAVRPFSVVGALGIFLLWFVAGVAVALAVDGIRAGTFEELPAELNLLGMCAASLPIAVWVVVRARRERPPQGTDTVPISMSLRIGGLGYLASAAIVLLLSLAMAALLTLVLGKPPELQALVKDVLESKSPLLAILITVLGILVAPFAEEAVFRGTLYPAARSLLGVRWGAVVVAALFAGIHGNLLAGVPLFGLALLLTWCYERTGSILAGVIVHATSNAASLLPLLLAR